MTALLKPFPAQVASAIARRKPAAVIPFALNTREVRLTGGPDILEAMQGICRLCQQPADLQGSHIIPSFVFRWAKDTSPTPFMRTSNDPERRTQDGIKKHWLCSDCEQELGVHEAQFASTIFHPITKNGSHRVAYSEWLLKFCVSISWRALLLASEKTSLSDFSDIERQASNDALHAWREFLCGRSPHPGQFEQHLLVFEDIKSYSGGPLPANMNRYALRSIELDVARSNDLGFTFVKMGPFAVLGFFNLAKPHEWSGGKIHVAQGMVGPTTYTLPISFYDYLIERARKYGAVMENLSDRQRAVADKTTAAGIMNNKEKLLGSHWMNAMQRDVDLFGDEAFKAGWPRKID